jgi:hypothetical protein
MKRIALTVIYDPDAGELLEVRETPHFSAEDALLRADVLQDTWVAIRARYAEAWLEAFPIPASVTAEE